MPLANETCLQLLSGRKGEFLRHFLGARIGDREEEMPFSSGFNVTEMIALVFPNPEQQD